MMTVINFSINKECGLPVSMNVQLIEEYCINHEGLFCVNPLK